MYIGAWISLWPLGACTYYTGLETTGSQNADVELVCKTLAFGGQ